MAEKKTTKKSKEETKVETKNKSVILSPRITEKSALKSEAQNVYTFNIKEDATKKRVIASIKADYKVTPVRVNMVAIPSKKKFVRGKWGVKRGGKKAYVYLKKGDKIEVA
ncbi:MAG: 50S ribosomal protein L23 [Minisyncoccota bacterium]